MAAPAASTDKSGSRVVLDTMANTAEALVAAKNIMAQVIVTWPGLSPNSHKLFWFVGSSVPDNTDYPDTIAPIGSRFTRLIITGDAVSGALEYVKTAAGTWTAQS